MFFAQLKNELWKLFGKKRTYIGFIMLLLAENGVSFFSGCGAVSSAALFPVTR